MDRSTRGAGGRPARLIRLWALLAAVALIGAACASTSDPGGSSEDTAGGEEVGGVATEAAEPAAFTLARPECIAPADPGGGWDFTCRSVGQTLQAAGLVDKQIQVTNMPGGGGGVAFAHVVAQRSEDNELIIAASNATTLRLAQGQYGSFDVSTMRWLGALGGDPGLVTVAADSPYETLDDLVEAWRADPRSITIGGGSAVGGQDNMKVLLLAEAVGIPVEDVKYVPFDGGGEAMTAMLGGFVDVFPGDVSENLGQIEAGNVRVLAALSTERLDMFPDVPTATELGYEVEWVVWRGLYAPGRMSDDAYDFWVDALRELEASPEWVKIRDESGLLPFGLFGDDFARFVEEEVEAFAELSASIGVS